MRQFLVAACVSWCASAAGAGVGYDAIGGSNASTNGAFWLTSATNTDSGGDSTTCCGVGFVSVPTGERVTEIQAVIGTRGPGGSGSINLASVTNWRVEFWSSEAAFGASPTTGNLRSLAYGAPTNPDYATPYGTDISGRPTYLVKFRLPGGIGGSGTTPSYFAIRINASQSSVGAIGVLESIVGGPSGLWASQTLAAPGYMAFSALPVHSHSGVFAYKLETGCGADANGDGALSVQDIFDFLGAWFAGQPSADFNGTGGLSVQDIFDFLGAWFAGC
jgi:hypothetical protein